MLRLYGLTLCRVCGRDAAQSHYLGWLEEVIQQLTFISAGQIQRETAVDALSDTCRKFIEQELKDVFRRRYEAAGVFLTCKQLIDVGRHLLD